MVDKLSGLLSTVTAIGHGAIVSAPALGIFGHAAEPRAGESRTDGS